MIPSRVIDTELVIDERVAETSRTYKMTETKIQGNADELDALKQAIYKVLSTEKYEYPIYSFFYGIELESLLGKDPAYVKIEMKRRIKECLLQNFAEIKSVENFWFENNGDELLCVFEVVSIYGSETISKGVTI
ncbi:MAG: DUF2634 domain-containing protein [Desulfitobacterium sp.]